MSRKIRLHAGFILLTVVFASGLGWLIGTREFAHWSQNYADMDEMNPELLTNVPLVKYEKSFDLGVLYGEIGTVTHEFFVTNTGRGVLKLSEPVPEDDSVTCVLPKREIEPNETIMLTISCTPQLDDEEFDASVMIQTNVPSEPEIEISLIGSVHAAVWPAEKTLEVSGVPTMSVFKTVNRVYSLVKNQPLVLSNLHVTDPQYVDFFSFEQTDAYHYDYSDVTPLPETGKIVTIAIKPGLPNKVFTVTVEGETNIPETPKFQFNIDFKLPDASQIPGIPGGMMPMLSPETQEGAESSAVPEKIDLESDTE